MEEYREDKGKQEQLDAGLLHMYGQKKKAGRRSMHEWKVDLVEIAEEEVRTALKRVKKREVMVKFQRIGGQG